DLLCQVRHDLDITGALVSSCGAARSPGRGSLDGRMDWQRTITAGTAGRWTAPSGARRRPVPLHSRAVGEGAPPRRGSARSARPRAGAGSRGPARAGAAGAAQLWLFGKI